ncbi:GNAT family N-acetyltransferase, partial [Nostoc sp. NIES-2111]
DVLPLARSWKTQQLRQTGLPDWFATPENVAFFDVMAARGLLVSSTLRWEGRLIAAFIGVECERRLSGWLFTYTPEPELRKYSVGHQLLLSLLQHSHASGHAEFDFSIGPDPYKLGYASHARVLRPMGPRPLPQALVHGTKKRAKAILVRAPALYEAVRGCKNLLRQTVGTRSSTRDTEGAPEERTTEAPAPAPQPQGVAPPPRSEATAPSIDPGFAAAIEEKIAARKAARLAKDFAGSDRIRNELAKLGVKLRDEKDPATGESVTHWDFVGPANAGVAEQVRQRA